MSDHITDKQTLDEQIAYLEDRIAGRKEGIEIKREVLADLEGELRNHEALLETLRRVRAYSFPNQDA